MIKKLLFLLITLLISINLHADFAEGKKLFTDKCASCHKEYISFKKLKENFFERNNTLLNLTIPTENMLAWAIMESSKKIGDKNDPDMQQMEIEEYLLDYLSNPDINNSICDVNVLKYYIKKDPMTISEKEAVFLAQYFMGYKKDRLKKVPKKEKTNLSENNDEEKILNRALNESKQIIVYATSQSCYFCKKMQKEVLDLKDVQDKINEDYLFVKIDVDFTKLPFKLKKHFKGMTPTFFVLSHDGFLQNIYPGSWSKEDFLLILKENL